MGRLITDNVFSAYYLMNRRGGGEGYAAIKVEVSKTYDRVEWDFLEEMRRKLGFCRRWIGP